MPFESLAFTDTGVVSPKGTVVLPVYFSVVPMTSTLTDPEAEPETTVTVITRLVLMAPADKLAVAIPARFVVVLALVKVPVSVANVTAMFGMLTLPASLTTAVMVT